MSPLTIFENTFGKKEEIQTYLKFGICVLFLVCLFSRACMYLFPKDLWLDEAYLFVAINSGSFSDLVRGQLANNQSAPFLFVIINKLIITYVGNVSSIIHGIPLVCSLISLVMMYMISTKIGNIFYIFSVMLLFSLCFTATYYSAEFKQYSGEMLASLLLLLGAIRNGGLEVDRYRIFSLKNIVFYIICILCSSTALLFLAGIILAQVIIAWRKKALRSLHIDYWNIIILGVFIAVYYLLYLKSGNSQFMKNYWRPFMIPMDFGAILKYFSDIGVNIFCGLFSGPPKFAVFIFIGLIGGSIMLWRKRMEMFLLLAMPVVVTVVANVFFYPPGYPWAAIPVRGRLLLFLLPNGVLVAAWFYGWMFSTLAAFATRPGNRHGIPGVRVRRLGCVAVVCGLVLGSGVANAGYLYGMGYKIQQIAGLVRVFQINSTPDSLNLLYGGATPAYQYYQALSGRKLPVEMLGWEWPKVRARLEHLPNNRRILLLVSHLGAGRLQELEELFTARGRTFVKIPDCYTCLYILPKQ